MPTHARLSLSKTISGKIDAPQRGPEAFYSGLSEALAMIKMSPRNAGEYILSKHAQHRNDHEAYVDLKRANLSITRLRELNFEPDQIAIFERGHQLFILRMADTTGTA
jgi:hypothetical protein